jgi:hypothetical protein
MFLLTMTEEEAPLFRKNGRTDLDGPRATHPLQCTRCAGKQTALQGRSLVMTPARKRADAAVHAWYADK